MAITASMGVTSMRQRRPLPLLPHASYASSLFRNFEKRRWQEWARRASSIMDDRVASKHVIDLPFNGVLIDPIYALSCANIANYL